MSELGYKTIQVSGADAFEFLQNQLTNDLQLLESEKEIVAAWCNPKGRVIWFGTVYKTDSCYALSVASDLAEQMVERLAVFRFRSKVEFAIEEGSTVDLASLIENGYPVITAQQSEKFTPHMLNLDLLGAVSVRKGCYPGQEVVARTHYRGATKRRMLRFESSAPVAAGDKVSDGERDVGEVLVAAGTNLLAVVPKDKKDQKLTVGDVSLLNLPLSYFQQ
jgi:folate-binding protein YgfZ